LIENTALFQGNAGFGQNWNFDSKPLDRWICETAGPFEQRLI
jgi:hypothetical protein